jgi:hypothetical protein
MFRSSTIIRELVLSLAKVILKTLGKIRRYMLCGDVAACLQLKGIFILQTCFQGHNFTECFNKPLARLSTS